MSLYGPGHRTGTLGGGRQVDRCGRAEICAFGDVAVLGGTDLPMGIQERHHVAAQFRPAQASSRKADR
jgi:hypothetical protein